MVVNTGFMWYNVRKVDRKVCFFMWKVRVVFWNSKREHLRSGSREYVREFVKRLLGLGFVGKVFVSGEGVEFLCDFGVWFVKRRGGWYQV